MEKQKELYQRYLNYLTTTQKISAEAAEKQLEMFVENQLQNTFRNFSLLSRFLSCPTMLRNQTVFSINQKSCAELINQYYEVEGVVFRELLGRFRQAKNRKRTLAEKCGKPQIVCKRMEGNFDRIYKFASQLTEGNVIDAIELEYLLPNELAQKYIRILFICYHKFDISKKSLVNVTYKMLDLMARSMLFWCSEKDNLGWERFQIDKKFSEKLKLIAKQLQAKEITDEMKQFVLNDFIPQGCVDIERKARLENLTTKLIAAVVNIGANIDQPREFKDFFLDIIEKLRNPLREKELGKKEMTTIFTKILLSFKEVVCTKDFISPNQKKKFNAAWQRYISCLKDCIAALYRVGAT